MSNPQEIIADVARRYLHVREKTKNQSPEIKEFWKNNSYKEGYDNREPWCAAFATFIVQKADEESEEINLRVPPRMASVAGFLEWAADPKNGCLTFGWSRVNPVYLPQRGDIVTFHFTTGNHIGIVDSIPYTKKETGEAYIKTVEGNTSSGAAGSQRDGDGVFERERSRTLCGTFVRLPTKASKA